MMPLHFHRSGSGEPLFILHGLFGTWENLGTTIKTLAEHYDVIAPDMLNHGRSPHIETFNYETMANAVLELADQLNIETFKLLGHSMGGKIAMELAINHPDRIEKLIVVDIAPVQYPHHHVDVFEGLKSISLETLNSRSEADKHLAKHVTNPSVRAFLLKNLYRNKAGRFEWRMHLSALDTHYQHIAAAVSKGRYSGPTLFIKGSDSEYLLADYQHAVTQRFANTQLRIIEGTGHWPHAEKPALFTKIVERFLSDSSNRAG